MKKILALAFCLVSLSLSAQSLKGTEIGNFAPDFTLNNPEGKAIKLSDFKGKYLLVDFWASWCGPCRRENPNVVKAYNEFKGKKFEILGISLDRGKDAWLNAIAKDGLVWSHVWDSKGEVATNLYRVEFIPQNFLLDPNGKIIAKGLVGESLEMKLKEVLK